jgi:pyruvate/2-oxoglutarate dehydrogenase complex dihydrolipoamide dehydrogenase (E3) component
VTAAASAGLGARVALIEAHMMGGDCLNTGCVPSKALIRCAKAIREVKGGAEYGVVVDPAAVGVDFGKIMERMRHLRADIAPVDSAPRFSKELGIDVFQGKAEFISRNQVKVNGQVLKFAKCTIATGGRARCPPVPGLKECEYLDNATLFNLTELPKRFGVLGAGPIGVEMAQVSRV